MSAITIQQELFDIRLAHPVIVILGASDIISADIWRTSHRSFEMSRFVAEDDYVAYTKLNTDYLPSA